MMRIIKPIHAGSGGIKSVLEQENHKNLFDNKEYQSKLTAGQMLKIAQEEFKDGYIEKL